MRSIKPLIRGLVGVATLGAAVAFASSGVREHDNDAAELARAKVGLTQAIATAEQHVQGKAIRAEVEDENGTLVYSVEVVKSNQVTDVKVNCDDGRLLSAQADPSDHEAEGRESGEMDDD